MHICMYKAIPVPGFIETEGPQPVVAASGLAAVWMQVHVPQTAFLAK